MLRATRNFTSATTFPTTRTRSATRLGAGARTNNTHSVAIRRKQACVAQAVSTLSPSWAPPSCPASHWSWEVTVKSIPTTSERRLLTVEFMSRRLSSVALYCPPISPMTWSNSFVLPSEGGQEVKIIYYNSMKPNLVTQQKIDTWNYYESLILRK